MKNMRVKIIFFTVIAVIAVLCFTYFFKAPGNSMPSKVINTGIIIPFHNYDMINFFEESLNNYMEKAHSNLFMNISSKVYENNNDLLMAILTMAQEKNEFIIYIKMQDDNEINDESFEPRLKEIVKHYPDPVYLLYTVKPGKINDPMSQGLKEFLNKLSVNKIEKGIIHNL